MAAYDERYLHSQDSDDDTDEEVMYAVPPGQRRPSHRLVMSAALAALGALLLVVVATGTSAGRSYRVRAVRGAMELFGVPHIHMPWQHETADPNAVAAQQAAEAAAAQQQAAQAAAQQQAALQQQMAAAAATASSASTVDDEYYDDEDEEEDEDDDDDSDATVVDDSQGDSDIDCDDNIDCDTGYFESGWTDGWSDEKMECCCQLYDRGCKKPRRMNFYMYRAQSDDNYAANNINMGDLPGVLWYLHNEVIVSTPRKFNVTRINRFRVTMMTTEEHYKKTGRQLAEFTAFDSGKCTVPGCEAIYEEKGFVVGCQNTESNQGLGNYVAHSHYPCTPGVDCKEGTWYSLPGPCPEYDFENKENGCNISMPGGQCQFDYGEGGGVTGFDEAPVTGEKDCTFYAKWAGQVYLNELIGLPVIDNVLGSPTAGQKIHHQAYHHWWTQGNQEYDVGSDTGNCVENSDYAEDSDSYGEESNAPPPPGGKRNIKCDFWAGRDDQDKCDERQRIIEDLFDTKFPFYPKTADLGEAPPCDAK